MLPSEREKRHVRVMGLDYGKAHTGVAVSDPTGTIVRPLPDIDTAGTPDGLNRVAALVSTESAGLVVVGMPISLAGSPGAQAHETMAFIDLLKSRLTVPVASWDERFTSKIASARGRFSNASSHSLAACVLLEDYLDSAAGGGQG
ncbi:MAG: Holliday junction resolvase RuvX [Thermoleophilia bacterium]